MPLTTNDVPPARVTHNDVPADVMDRREMNVPSGEFTDATPAEDIAEATEKQAVIDPAGQEPAKNATPPASAKPDAAKGDPKAEAKG